MHQLSKVVNPPFYKSQDIRKAHLSRTQPAITLPGDLGTSSFYDENSEVNSNMHSIMIVNEVDTDQIRCKTEADDSGEFEVSPFTMLSMSFYEKKASKTGPGQTTQPSRKGIERLKESGLGHYRPNLKFELASPQSRLLRNNNREGERNAMATPSQNQKGVSRGELFAIDEQDGGRGVKRSAYYSPQAKLRNVRKGIHPAMDNRVYGIGNVKEKGKLGMRGEGEEKGVIGKGNISSNVREDKGNNANSSNVSGNKGIGTAVKKSEVKVAGAKKDLGASTIGQKMRGGAVSKVTSVKMAGKYKGNVPIVKKEVKNVQDSYTGFPKKMSSLHALDMKRTNFVDFMNNLRRESANGAIQSREKKNEETGAVKKGVQMPYKLPLHRLQIDLSSEQRRSPVISSHRMTNDSSSVPQSYRSERGDNSTGKKDAIEEKENVGVNRNIMKGSTRIGDNRRTTLEDDGNNKIMPNKIQERFNDYHLEPKVNRLRDETLNSPRGDESTESLKGFGWQNYFKTSLNRVLEASEGHNKGEKGNYADQPKRSFGDRK